MKAQFCLFRKPFPSVLLGNSRNLVSIVNNLNIQILNLKTDRDIVDTMGVMGVEGKFRICCEFTMEVMRKQDSTLTLLEELLSRSALCLDGDTPESGRPAAKQKLTTSWFSGKGYYS